MCVCVDVSLSLVDSYGVQGYPTIKIFGANKKRPESYDGARVSSAIVETLEAKAMDFVDPPEVVQLRSEQIVKDNCEAKQICLVAFLPHILDSVKAFIHTPFFFWWGERGVDLGIVIHAV